MLLVAICLAETAVAQEKVILDTDFTTIGDDGQVAIMAAHLHAQGVIELLGISVVAGNEWMPQEVAEAVKAVERLGIAEDVGVYAAQSTLLPSQEPCSGKSPVGRRRLLVPPTGTEGYRPGRATRWIRHENPGAPTARREFHRRLPSRSIPTRSPCSRSVH